MLDKALGQRGRYSQDPLGQRWARASKQDREMAIQCAQCTGQQAQKQFPTVWALAQKQSNEEYVACCLGKAMLKGRVTAVCQVWVERGAT